MLSKPFATQNATVGEGGHYFTPIRELIVLSAGPTPGTMPRYNNDGVIAFLSAHRRAHLQPIKTPPNSVLLINTVTPGPGPARFP